MPLYKNTISAAFCDSFYKTLNIVVAYTFNKQGIGKNGMIPWHIPEDIAHFKKLTTGELPNPTSINNIVIMGRKTWESIPDKYKPLSNRYNVILSNNMEYINEQTRIHAELHHKFITFTTWNLFINSKYKEIEKIITDHNAYPITSKYQSIKYFVIGGGDIYKMVLETEFPINIYVTEIYASGEHTNTQNEPILKCDAFFPKCEYHKDPYTITNVSPFYQSSKKHIYIKHIPTQPELPTLPTQHTITDVVVPENIEIMNNPMNSPMNNLIDLPCECALWYRFITITKQTHFINKYILFKSAETPYLELMNNILEHGQKTNDRTGIGTLSLFGEMLKFNLRDTFPISTTKRIFFRAIFEELMLYLSGKTDNAILQQKGIHVWDGNTSREFLDQRGLIDYPVGDMGQTYGFNMRHFGGKYINCKTDYPVGYGYDQLANAIYLIKNDPYSRRIIIDLWDSSTTDKAALPSCLCKYQFNVNVEAKELNLAIYLRSSDYFLANNWNTCTGALLVHLLCNLKGINLTPGDLTVFIADAHIYKSHIEQVKENLQRRPHPQPKLIIHNTPKRDILEYDFDDIELLGYKSHPNIKAEMAV